MSASATSISPTSEAGRALAENGRVLATLDDWRAIVFVLVGVIVVLVLKDVWDRAHMRRERKDMSDERQRMWTLAQSFGEASGKLAAQMDVMSALAARVEMVIGQRVGGPGDRG